MLNYLLYFQFALMYLLVLVIGLVVYGSDFDGITGWLYVTPLLVYTVAHGRIWSHRNKLGSGNTPRVIYAIGAIAALFAYAPMHMDYWDEHSLSQSVWMAILGLCSYLSCVVAAAKITRKDPPCQNCAVFALVAIGLIWLLARYYPTIVLLGLGLLFIVSALWSEPLQHEIKPAGLGAPQSDVIARYTLFLLTIDIGCIVWDYQVNTAWALYIGLSLMAAALGFYIKQTVSKVDRLEQAVYVIAIINFVLAVLWPAYLLWMFHALAAGFCVGFLLRTAISAAGDEERLHLSMGWVVWFFMGLVLSNAWYANLQWAATRLVAVLPFVLLAFLFMKYRIAASKQHV